MTISTTIPDTRQINRVMSMNLSTPCYRLRLPSATPKRTVPGPTPVPEVLGDPLRPVQTVN